MSKKPRRYTAKYKFNLAVKALQEQERLVQLASDNEMHPRQVTRWRNKLLAEGPTLFEDRRLNDGEGKDPDKEELLHMIDQLSAELEFLKKKLRRDR